MENDILYFENAFVGFKEVANVIAKGGKIVLQEKAIESIKNCRAYLDNKLQVSDELFYGINTGFGYLQHVKIDHEQTEQLQENLILSHACGMGEEVPKVVVQLMLLFKIKSLCFGYSGVQYSTVQRLIDLYNHQILPVVYQQGSLGASGDLAPLSHLCLPLIGKGEVRFEGEKKDTHEILNYFGLSPIVLKSKEGLALINGTQFMSAYGMYNLVRAKRLLNWANLIGSLSLDAFCGSTEPFHPKLHSIRAHNGQIWAAKAILDFLNGSEIANQPKQQVQDPYSFRCMPQVHGASKETFDFVSDTFLREINSVTDNPNIFPEDDLILSGGNFHGQPLALGMDFLAISMAEIGSISERRTFQLLSGVRNLPIFLIEKPGLHSGLMIPQYTAAGLVSENKQWCTPASVDSITSSNGQEDHVSMGANAAVKCSKVIENIEKILAIELLVAAQALDYRKPLKSSPVIEQLHDSFRKVVPFLKEDRILHFDMMKAVQFLQKEPEMFH